MLRQLRASLQMMRPRSMARMQKSLDDLAEGMSTLRRAAKEQAALLTRVEDMNARLLDLTDRIVALTLRESQLRAVATADASFEEAMEQLHAICDAPRVIAHVRAAVERSRLTLDPMPHLIVSDVLPPDFYQALLRGIPPYALFADRPHNKQSLKVPFEYAPAFSRTTWNFLLDVALEGAFQPAIVEKFREPLAEWIGREWPPIASDPLAAPLELHTTDGRILLRGRGYEIPPHRDPKWGFITVLLYLARGGESEQWGTQLYAVEEDEAATSIAPHWIEGQRCRLVVDVPFRRNSALVFLNSHGAHGACIPGDAEPAGLQRYIYQFRIGPTKASIKALVEMLPEERRSAWQGKMVDYLA